MEEPVKEKAKNNLQVHVKKYAGSKKYLTLKMAQFHFLESFMQLILTNWCHY